MTRFQPPSNDEIEISIFGPGYGETVVVHLGLGDWLIVDSCFDRSAKRPASINYLSSIGVNFSSAVKIIVASHWHDDHVGGLAAVFDECPGAEFVCSASLKTTEFLTLVRAAGTRSIDRGLQEFAKIVNLLRERKISAAREESRGPRWAMEDRVLWRRNDPKGFSVEISALSPADASITLAHNEISQLIPTTNQQKKKIIAMTPNQTAVVLWVKIGDQSIMLGSDLEEEPDAGRGWSVIVDSPTRPKGAAEIFKVAHHGSANGHHPRVWSEMLSREPFAILTPFGKGSGLPTRQDVHRISQLTPNAFLTTQLQVSQKKRYGALDRTIKEVVRSIRTVPNVPGHIRLRRGSADDSWHVELYDGAVRLPEAITR